MFCPLLKAECIGHKCAWYMESVNECAIYELVVQVFSNVLKSW
jgi:hypothetical protein